MSAPASPVADPVHDVMREQFEFLLEHAELAMGTCVCSTCERYYRVRAALLDVFGQGWVRVEK